MSILLAQFDAVFNILIVVTVISLITRRFNFPQTIALIIAGIYSTVFTRFSLPYLESEIFVSILLPPILFQETLHRDVHELIEDADMVLSYAVLGTLSMVISISTFSFFVLGFGVIESLLLGIIIAPTDPVSVIGTFNSMGVVKRFQMLVTGESLFNDGVAIVIYSILMSVATLGAITVLDIARLSVISVLGGLLLGILSGYVAHLLFCWTDDKYVEVLISFLIAFGGFRLAEELGASGVLATVVSGLIINYRCKNYGGLGRQSIDMLDTLWEFVGFIAQSMAFIFIGMNTDTAVLYRYIAPVFVIVVFTLLARYIMVLVVGEILMITRDKFIPNNWTIGLTWSGLRGGVSVVLALGAASLNLHHSEEILALTFGVVLTSNIVQGLSMSRIINLLNLSEAKIEAEAGQPDGGPSEDGV
ncbi:MAG: sodium:proton antiporter [Candidatus Bathyarchaeota archaeon]|nr:MAG: sodium:proton antiporter [Candidatus Bathyarchaeota archaeon]